jgi:mitochondrial pyruvate carrier 2
MGIVPIIQNAVSKLPLPTAVKAFLDHPAGPFTIFFWAPTFKWAITLSNISDMKRPPELISANQQMAIFGTGILWTRYATQINPVNYNLMVVNFFMAATAGYQLYRKM